MKCPVCKKHVLLKRIGATIGAGQLTACPNCGVVFCEAAIHQELRDLPLSLAPESERR